jgi:hypothetical protein
MPILTRNDTKKLTLRLGSALTFSSLMRWHEKRWSALARLRFHSKTLGYIECLLVEWNIRAWIICTVAVRVEFCNYFSHFICCAIQPNAAFLATKFIVLR